MEEGTLYYLIRYWKLVEPNSPNYYTIEMRIGGQLVNQTYTTELQWATLPRYTT
jgi:hypothetical protein